MSTEFNQTCGSFGGNVTEATRLSIGDAIAFVRKELSDTQMQKIQNLVSNSHIDYEILEGVKKFLKEKNGEEKLYDELAELKKSFMENLDLMYADLDTSIMDRVNGKEASKPECDEDLDHVGDPAHGT